MILRKFYPLELYVIENIVNFNLCMSNPKRFNDPFDCALLRDRDFLKNLKEDEKQLFERIRILCLFIVDKSKPEYEETQRYFWSFYGDSHKGFCIEFDIPEDMFKTDISENGEILKLIKNHKYMDLLKEKMFSGNMEYYDDIINNIEILKSHINRTDAVEILEKAIFYKDAVFNRENEFRIIKYTDNAIKDFDFFSIKKYKKRLIFGKECPQTFKDLLKNMRNTASEFYEVYEVNSNMNEVKL